MVQLNKNNITNQYLYGQLTTPTNLADESLIRSKDAITEVEVDVVEFMATGAGRFAVGSQFTLVQRFFAPFLTSPPVPIQDLMSDLKATNPATYFGLGSFDDYPLSPFGLNRVLKEEEVEEQVIVGYEQVEYSCSAGQECGGGYGNYYVSRPIYETQIKKVLVEVDEGNAYVYQTNQSLTDNENLVLSAINYLSFQTQADEPEAQLDALLQAATSAGFRDDTTRFIVLTTDASYHEGSPHTTVSQVKAALEDASVIPIFAVTPGVVSTYQGLVAELGVGAVVSLNSDSSDLVDVVAQNLTNNSTNSELISIVQGASNLNLNESYFTYV